MRAKRREKTADVTARWKQVLAPMRDAIQRQARHDIEHFFADTLRAAYEIASLHVSLHDGGQRFRWDSWTAQQACRSGDMEAFKIATISLPLDIHRYEVAKTLWPVLKQAVKDVEEGQRDKEQAIAELTKKRTDLLMAFFPAFIHAIQWAGEEDDEKALQFLTAYVAQADGAKTLRYALERERSLELEHHREGVDEEPEFAELATAVALLRVGGTAPLSAENVLAMPARAADDVRTFDPTRPEGGLCPLDEETLNPRSMSDHMARRQVAGRNARQQEIRAWRKALSPRQKQLADATERLKEALGRVPLDAEIAPEMGVSIPDVANTRRWMLKKLSPELWQEGRRRKSA